MCPYTTHWCGQAGDVSLHHSAMWTDRRCVHTLNSDVDRSTVNSEIHSKYQSSAHVLLIRQWIVCVFYLEGFNGGLNHTSGQLKTENGYVENDNLPTSSFPKAGKHATGNTNCIRFYLKHQFFTNTKSIKLKASHFGEQAEILNNHCFGEDNSNMAAS